jgi:two-component SAPR family response regulator
MPSMNGIELAAKIQQYSKDIQIVFISAYPQYAINAFKVNAVNYILKPITKEQMDITTERLLRNYNLTHNIKKRNVRYIIQCFGSFKVYDCSNKDCVKWSTSKSEQLFAYFVYNRNELHDKWKLCDILWCNSTPKNLQQNLHSTIHRLKNDLKNIGIENIIFYNQGMYRIDLTKFNCDIFTFKDFIFSDKVVDSNNINEYEEIIGLYKGELFEGKDYTWIIDSKETFNNYHVSVVKKVINYYMHNEEYIKAEFHIKKLLKINPFDEQLHELIMSIYFYSGDNQKLITYYNEVCNLFEKELGLKFEISLIGEIYKNLKCKNQVLL